jgi:hypothetical protein
MAFRPLKSFFSTADELLQKDLRTLGSVLLTHLKSYEGLNTVYQYAGLNRGYFRAMLENRNVGLGPLPKEPEYGTRQPEVTKRMMEVWNWLERQGLLIHNDQQVADWFIISSEGEEYLTQEKLPPSPNSARVSKFAGGVPRAFLSYSWDDPEHQQWVTEFAERLHGKSGVEIIFDRWHLNPGDDKLHFMEQAVAASNFVMVVCTPTYAERANRRQGGVGYESMVITAELAEHVLTNKFIPVLRKGVWAASLPVYLKTRIGVNLSDEPYHEDEYEKLLRVLHGEPIQPPPLGSKPDFSKQPQLPLSAPATRLANALQTAPVTSGPLQRRHLRSSEFLPELNPKEIELLVSAARDSSGQISRRKAIGGDQLHVGDRAYMDSRNARSVAEWLGAVKTLVSEDLLEDVGQNGDFYRVTDSGYAAADLLVDFVRWPTNQVTVEARYFNAPTETLTLTCSGVIQLPAVYYQFRIRADLDVTRSEKESRTLLVEGADLEVINATDWKPNHVSFVIAGTNETKTFLVERTEDFKIVKFRIKG